MAASNAFLVVNLEENDVPGAKLVYSLVEQHSNCQLQRWLECRSLPKTGNRSELIDRVNNCIKCGADKDITVNIDGGKWYEKKLEDLKKLHTTKTKPYMPLSGWGTFPSCDIPKHFNMGHIHHHIVESVQFLGTATNMDDDNEGDDIDDLHTAKPMKKGQIFFKSGHVQHMKDSKKDEHYFVKAKVMASYKIDVFYDTTVVLSCESGFVKDASCSCVASGMGRCNHIAALLFAILDYAELHGYEKVACTSTRSKWNVGRKRKKNPQKSQDTAKLTGKAKKVHNIIKFDPRPPSLQNSTEDEAKSDLLWSLGCHDESDAMWNTILFPTYTDFTLEDTDIALLKTQRSILLENLSVGNGDAPVEVVNGQRSNDWFAQRRLRITASNCKTISKLDEKSSIVTISNSLQTLMWQTKQLTTIATVYGQVNEDQARNIYLEDKRKHNAGFSAKVTGFWVNPAHPELGCSPDGLAIDPEEVPIYGLIEIKCPKVLEKKDVFSFETLLTKNQLQNFYLQKQNGEITLKKSHPYFYQVQMQMGILGRQWCDFIVWSEVSFLTLRIRFDENFWNSLKDKLVAFHHKYVCPEHFCMKVPRELSPILLPADNLT